MESSWLKSTVNSSWSLQGRIKAVQSKQVWQLTWKGEKLIMGIYKLQKVFFFSKLSHFFFSWFNLYCYQSGKAWCADPWWTQQVPISYNFWTWNRSYSMSHRLKCLQRPDRLYKCVWMLYMTTDDGANQDKTGECRLQPRHINTTFCFVFKVGKAHTDTT